MMSKTLRASNYLKPVDKATIHCLYDSKWPRNEQKKYFKCHLVDTKSEFSCLWFLLLSVTHCSVDMSAPLSLLH